MASWTDCERYTQQRQHHMLRPRKNGPAASDVLSHNGVDSRRSSSNGGSPSNNKRRRPSSGVGNSIRPGFLLSCVILVFGAFAIVHFLLFFVAHHRLAEDNRGGSSNGSGGATTARHKWEQSSKNEYTPKMAPPRPYVPPAKSLFNKKPTRNRQTEKKDKAGKVVYKPITKFHKDDLEPSMLNPNITSTTTHKLLTYEEAIQGRERLVDILHEAGIEEMDVEVIASLPQWSDITKLYGGNEGPVIVGLERCEEFRRNAPLDDASMGTAGMFNTGTNPFAMYLENNCIMPHNKNDRAGGTRWQVPWGKHMLASRKWNNTAKRDERVNKTNVMPIVLVRDPYSWMQSMCKSPYEARWDHKTRCPNLINPKTHEMNQVKVVHYNPDTYFDSLVHYWAQWYREYLEADYPRLMIRFEDLHFHAKELIDTICQCAGGVARDPQGDFQFISDSAKWGAAHTKSKTNMVTAMIKYGHDKNRFNGMSDEDIDFATTVLTPEWMNLFQYEMPKRQQEALAAAEKAKR